MNAKNSQTSTRQKTNMMTRSPSDVGGSFSAVFYCRQKSGSYKAIKQEKGGKNATRKLDKDLFGFSVKHDCSLNS